MASEDKIRDYLADNLHLVEEELTLIKKEQYLPNDTGASGFVDVFCKDKFGKIVIIEIRRDKWVRDRRVKASTSYKLLVPF